MEKENMEKEFVPASVDLEDGAYTIEVELEGGTGRAAVTSPAGMLVQDGKAWATIEWSSSRYDYMVVEGETYFPVNEEGNSAFEIPILIFDEPMEIIADTTAMSVPHEVEYTLTFDSETIRSGTRKGPGAMGLGLGIALIAAVLCSAACYGYKKRRKSAKV